MLLLGVSSLLQTSASQRRFCGLGERDRWLRKAIRRTLYYSSAPDEQNVGHRARAPRHTERVEQGNLLEVRDARCGGELTAQEVAAADDIEIPRRLAVAGDVAELPRVAFEVLRDAGRRVARSGEPRMVDVADCLLPGDAAGVKLRGL